MAWFLPLLWSLGSVGITLVYPAWCSINAIESRAGVDDTQWLIYWLCYALFTMVETPLWIVFQWVPGYSILRLAFFAWLVLPQTKGATFVYEAVLRPVVRILKKEIAKNPTLDRTLNGPGMGSSVSGAGHNVNLGPNSTTASQGYASQGYAR